MAQVVDDDSNMVVHLALLLRPERGAEVRLPNSPTPAPAGCLRTVPVGGQDRVGNTNNSYPLPESAQASCAALEQRCVI